METFKQNLSWYQSKIGEHDKQSWEQTVEERVLRSIDDLPKRDANPDTREFLDVDLIKGSTFTKAKPKHTSYIRTWKGLYRILLMPFFWRWWIEHTSLSFLLVALVLYVTQITVTIAYCIATEDVTKNVSLFEVTNPLMFMVVLSIMHTQIVFTQTNLVKKFKKKAIAIKRVTVKRERSRKSKSGQSKRKSKSQSSIKTDIQEAERAKPQKLSSPDSSDIEDVTQIESNGSLMYEETSEYHEGDEEGLSSEESFVPDSEIIRPSVLIDEVPDVAAGVEEKIAAIESGSNHAMKQWPYGWRNVDYQAAAVNPVDTQTRANSLADSLPDSIRLRPVMFESEGTSDMDRAPISHTSDTEWENNRVCRSDVAGTDSSSDYLSESEQEEEEPSADGPIALKRKHSQTLAYVPSAFDKISCIVWEKNQCKKVDLSVIEIGGSIEAKINSLDFEPTESLCIGIICTCLIASFPFLFRFYHSPTVKQMIMSLVYERTPLDLLSLLEARALLLGSTWQERAIIANGVVQRLFLCSLFCFLVIVAERSYWQKLQYAKFFCYLTSARRSKKYNVPHFRLNKVKNIKIWLSLRAYLKKRGPQRSVEVIVSAVFILMVSFLAIMCVQLLTDIETYLLVYGNWELTLCCMTLTCYLLRFYSLGTKITKKYRNLSTLITEQINLYLHMEQKPDKKETLLLANSVLKLAESLIKELESPFKLSNTLVNPVVFNVTRLVMLSAFSAVVSELLGFKLKLHKVKL